MSQRLPIVSGEVTQKRLTRNSPFSYSCNRCKRCCQNQRIRVNPYEIARLANRLGISTTEFISKFTTENKIELSRDYDGYCIFLTEDGCAVHKDRPLVCRIYPLGRHLSWSQEEDFNLLEPHPQSEGIYGDEKTVEDYLKSQGAYPYIEAVDSYIRLVRELSEVAELKKNVEENPGIIKEWASIATQTSEGQLLSDMDLALEVYCKEKGIQVPTEVEHKYKLHIQFLTEFADELRVSEESAT